MINWIFIALFSYAALVNIHNGNFFFHTSNNIIDLVSYTFWLLAFMDLALVFMYAGFIFHKLIPRVYWKTALTVSATLLAGFNILLYFFLL